MAVATVAGRLARFTAAADATTMPAQVVEKAQGCLTDYIACTLEARALPWGKQALEYAGIGPEGPATVIGSARRISAPDAAFVNGTLGHGLVREDMHVASCCHLGVVIWPTLLALADLTGIGSGKDFLAAGVVGYEVGARVGRALFDADLAAKIRPTSTVGAIGAAAAGARLLGLTEEQTIVSIGFAANCAGGVNEWPWVGGTDVFFHAGFAARNAVTGVLLARAGAYFSPSAIDGRAGLFAAFDRRSRADGIVPLADGQYEIMSVYWKPAPACNYVQTPCQAALAVAGQVAHPSDIAAIQVGSFRSAIRYPGCDHAGPFDGVLAGKMSIQYSVAATLVHGTVAESNYANLDNAEVLRLAKATTLSVDPQFERAFPARQGAEVTVVLKDGIRIAERRDDVRPVDRHGVRERYLSVATQALGSDAAEILAGIDALASDGTVAAVARRLARA
jgi:2-methylcitrate dehydratase PrpD